MGGNTGRFRQEIKDRLKDSGALAVGFAQASEVDPGVYDRWLRWIKEGRHAGMKYMELHGAVRKDPRLLLEGARSIISMAFSYNSETHRDPRLPRISKYAFLPDYHDWIKKRIRQSGVADLLGEEHREWRICVDTAPIFERYWAQRAGIAFIGHNGNAVVPGAGGEVFLAEIICTAEFEYDNPLQIDCGSCMKCVGICPTGALGKERDIDCNRCISYLTIEHSGPWTEEVHREAMQTEAGRNTLFGCDRCVAVCPHNQPDVLAPIAPIAGIGTFSGTVAPPKSCLKRAKAEGLRRNLKGV